MSSSNFGDSPPGPGSGVPPEFTPQGFPVTPGGLPQQQATLQTIMVTLNAILAQLKTGIALVAQVPTYTFANLPSAATNPALVVFCSNARKPSEGAGMGSGMLCFSDSVNWISTAGTILAD